MANVTEPTRWDRIRLENRRPPCNKFWETDIVNAPEKRCYRRRVFWGRIGTAGGSTDYPHSTLLEARAAQQRAIRIKLAEGYTVTGGDPEMVRAFAPVKEAAQALAKAVLRAGVDASDFDLGLSRAADAVSTQAAPPRVGAEVFSVRSNLVPPYGSGYRVGITEGPEGTPIRRPAPRRAEAEDFDAPRERVIKLTEEG